MAYLEGHGFVSPDYLAFSIFKNQLDELVVVFWQSTVRRLADFDTRLHPVENDRGPVCRFSSLRLH